MYGSFCTVYNRHLVILSMEVFTCIHHFSSLGLIRHMSDSADVSKTYWYGFAGCLIKDTSMEGGDKVYDV